MREHSRVCAHISLGAARDNFAMMRDKLRGGAKLCAVVKADGYGHGALRIAQEAEDLDFVWGFAVATVDEAARLREGGIRKPILVLGHAFREDHPRLVELGIRPTLFDLESAAELSRLAEKRRVRLPVHLKLDTGMSRIGMSDDERGLETALRIAGLPGLRVEGLFAHFARADEADKTNALEATARYLRFVEALRGRGLAVPIRHCCNSAGLLELPEAHFDMARAGIIIYGIYPSGEMNRAAAPLRPVMRLVSHVAYVKDIAAGAAVSYGGTFVAQRPMRIATVPVGYGDGYPRSLSNKGQVLIHGKRVPIVGRVCMDQFMVDVTGLEARQYDEVVLMGRSGDEEITVDELGALSGRFPYEFVCDVGKRVPRVYVE